MFSELPKLLDRNFTLGYLLPASLLLAGTLHLLVLYGHVTTDDLAALLEATPWLGAAGAVLTAWLLALVLLAANRFLVRFFEGYLLPRPIAERLCRRQRKRFAKLQAELASLRSRRKGETGGRRAETEARLAVLGARLARQFPDREELILPTGFGNILRAFEVYPRVLYGAESIILWPRLLAVASDAQRELVDQAKAQVDLWVNLGAVAPLLVLEYAILAAFAGRFELPVVPLIALGALPVIRWASRSTALAWGSVVESTFDVHLGDLREKLELPRPESREQERALWTGYSQAALYRLAPLLPERAPGRSEDEGPEAEEAPPWSVLVQRLLRVIGGCLDRRSSGER